MNTALGSPMVNWAAVLLFEVMDKEISASQASDHPSTFGFRWISCLPKECTFSVRYSCSQGIASFVLLAEEFMDASVRDAILQEGGYQLPNRLQHRYCGLLALPIWGTLIGKRRRLETNGQ